MYNPLSGCLDTAFENNGGLQNLQRAFPQEQIIDFKAGNRLTVTHPQVKQMLERIKDKEGLHDLIVDILNSSWYKNRKNEEPPSRPLRKYIPKRPVRDDKGSSFGAFFSRARPYICFLCDDGKDRRSFTRALGHARGHFGVKIDGNYTNKNTKNDQDRRKAKPHETCSKWYALICLRVSAST